MCPASCLREKSFSETPSSFQPSLGVEFIHRDELKFIGTGQRGTDAFLVNELAHLGHDFHAFVTPMNNLPPLGGGALLLIAM